MSCRGCESEEIELGLSVSASSLERGQIKGQKGSNSFTRLPPEHDDEVVEGGACPCRRLPQFRLLALGVLLAAVLW